MSKEEPKFELLAPTDAETEKRIAGHAKNIGIYDKGVNTSGAQLYGYSFLLGREINLAAEVIPHGQLGKWIKSHYPKISHGKEVYMRGFAKRIEEKLWAKLSTVDNLKAGKRPLQLKKSFSKKELEAILEVVPDMMDGKTLTDFMRGAGMAKQPEKAGGFRPDAAALKEWLAKHHPELVETPWSKLPAEIKKAFRQDYEHPTPSEADVIEAHRADWRDLIEQLGVGLDGKTYIHLAEDLEEFKKAQLVLHDLNQAFRDVIQKAKA